MTDILIWWCLVAFLLPSQNVLKRHIRKKRKKNFPGWQTLMQSLLLVHGRTRTWVLYVDLSVICNFQQAFSDY